MLSPNTNSIQEALGSAMIDAKAAEKVLALEVTDLGDQRDRDILSAMKTLQVAGTPITLITLDKATDEQYTTYLIDISTSVVTPSLIDHYIRDIQEKARRRRLQAAASVLDGAGPADILWRAQSAASGAQYALRALEGGRQALSSLAADIAIRSAVA